MKLTEYDDRHESEEIKEKLINKGIPFEEYKDERGADKTSRKQRCGDCYRKI